MQKLTARTLREATCSDTLGRPPKQVRLALGLATGSSWSRPAVYTPVWTCVNVLGSPKTGAPDVRDCQLH